MPGEQPEVTPSTETAPAEPHFDVVRRGFDPAQVVEHVKREGERSRELESRLAGAVGELAAARQELESVRATPQDPMAGVSRHVTDLLRGFDEEIERQRRGVELEFTGMLAEARTEAAQLRIDAQTEADQARGRADRLLREAQEEAARVRSEMEALRGSTLDELRGMRDRMRSSLKELEVALPEDEESGPVIVLGDTEHVPPAPRPAPPPGT